MPEPTHVLREVARAVGRRQRVLVVLADRGSADALERDLRFAGVHTDHVVFASVHALENMDGVRVDRVVVDERARDAARATGKTAELALLEKLADL